MNNENNIYSSPSSLQHENKNEKAMKTTKVHCRRVGSLTFIKLIPIGLFIGYILLMTCIAILAQFGIEHPSVSLGKITGSIVFDTLIMAIFLALFESIFVIPFLLIGLYLYSKISTTSIYVVDKKDD
jgi:ABC-type transporter Mla maintaining outer membrane lipid asymmetry permease subunit MlaE